MNFLEISQAICREAGIGGGQTVPTSVVGQVGELKRIVEYAKQALIEIESIHMSSGLNLRYMRKTFTLTSVPSQSEYAYNDAAIVDDDTGVAITSFGSWMVKDCNEKPKIYLQSATVGTQGYLNYLEWYEFKRLYRLGTQNPEFPAHIGIKPDNKLVLGPKPNGIYIVNGDYLRAPQVMAANTDTPDMPSQFHNAIVFKGLTKYGLMESAPECVTKGEDSYATYLGNLEGDQLSTMYMAGPMC